MFYVEFLRGCLPEIPLSTVESICKKIDKESAITATGPKGLVMVKFPIIEPSVSVLSEHFPSALSIQPVAPGCPVILVTF